MPTYPTPPPAPALPINEPYRPAVQDAMNALKAYYPDVGNLIVKERDMSDPLAFSNILGQTKPNQDIELNPVMVALSPTETIADTLAHELQHVRQMRQGNAYQFGPSDNPYLGSPSEQDAFKAQHAFAQRPGVAPDNINPVMQGLWNSLVGGDTAIGIFKKKLLDSLK